MINEPQDGQEIFPHEEYYAREKQVAFWAYAWDIYQINSAQAFSSFDDQCFVDWVTNDDNDNGFPSRWAQATYYFHSVWDALLSTNGGTHFGYHGRKVMVVIDGDEVFTYGSYKNDKGHVEYRAYCPYPRRATSYET